MSKADGQNSSELEELPECPEQLMKRDPFLNTSLMCHSLMCHQR